MDRLLFIAGLLLMCFRQVYDVDSHFRFVVHSTFTNVTGAESGLLLHLFYGHVVLKHQVISRFYEAASTSFNWETKSCIFLNIYFHKTFTDKEEEKNYVILVEYINICYQYWKIQVQSKSAPNSLI